MKILLIGASGVIGSAIHKALAEEHEVITATRSSGDIKVDLSDMASIRDMYRAVSPIDAVICAAGAASMGPLAEMSDEAFSLALDGQLKGQGYVLRCGLKALKPGGSITVTSGAAAQATMPGTAVIAASCAALESLVRVAAAEDDAIRLNVVSPSFVTESMAQLGLPTEGGVSAADTAKSYIAALTGNMHGAVLPTAASS